MAESLKTKTTRWAYNFFPATRRTSMRITYIASDWSEVRIKLPFNWKTKNIFGTMFGGSMYAAIDPGYVVMLTNILGRNYRAIDKSATIHYRKPARTTLYSTFLLDNTEIDSIKSSLNQTNKIDRIYNIDLVDKDGSIYASFEKTINIRKK